MNQTIKNVLAFYAVVLLLLFIMCAGIYILDSYSGALSLSATLILIPLATIVTIIALLKDK